MIRPLLPVIGLPRVEPDARIVMQPELTRAPVRNCNTCRFERTPMAQSPCNTCCDGYTPHGKWQPK